MVGSLLINIIREELYGSDRLPDNTISQINSDTLAQLYRMSKSQDLSHIVADALEKSELLDGSEISEKFKNQKSDYRLFWYGDKKHA